MASSSCKCVVDECKRPALALCYCCQKSVCRTHFNEHADRLDQSIPLLADGINRLLLRLSSIKPSYLKQLDEWRLKTHQSLDSLCERWAQKHIDEIKNKSRQELDRLKLLINQQDVTKERI